MKIVKKIKKYNGKNSYRKKKKSYLLIKLNKMRIMAEKK